MRGGSASISRGFTILELLVVLAAVALLLSVAMPRYVAHIDHAREVALKHDLRAMREAIDKFRADVNRNPASLDELVARRYLRAMPTDPITDRADTWAVIRSEGDSAGITDVRSGARGRANDGSVYATW